ncbi:TIGR02285 family protein [Bdellovibrio svalbardensis]|uniref:TIGR02285 family protein n=1 Tax=Bdellovibrio svalbardensis TaxID=2972972 RepID=A0ABT6DLA8_9BACT|nr:TIGR02285 family protein [Bdellovibrio svalbardensis]MDG0816694.1 TIGR02285 family protein [Bdellovibrio svalbardensis]
MYRLLFLFLVFLCSLHFSGMASAQVKESSQITWIRWDDPPIFIFAGPYRGQGLLDVVEVQVQKYMPQYEHKKIEGTVLRVLKEAENQSPICNAGWLDTPEWRKLFYFSKPVFVIPTNGVLIKESHLKEIVGLQPYALQKFLDKKPEWKLGVGRLYGEGIDPILFKNDYQKNPKFVPIATSLRVHQMLQNDRIQYTLGYPFEAVYYNELLKNKDKVVYVPLTDNSSFVEVVVACPKNEWGKKVIADVNKVLEKPMVLAEIEKGVDRWLSKEDQRRLIQPRLEMLKKR